MASNGRSVGVSMMLAICLLVLGMGPDTGLADRYDPHVSDQAQPQQRPTSGWTNHDPKSHRLKAVPTGYEPDKEACLKVNSPDLSFSYRIEATYDMYARNHPPSLIRFVRETPGEPRVALTYPGDGHVLNMLSLESGSVVVIVFELGSGIEVKAFRLEEDRVLLVFDRGTESQPEFPWDVILLNVGKLPQPSGAYYPAKTEIWTWTGQKYRLAATVPFKQRYGALQKLPPSAWK